MRSSLLAVSLVVASSLVISPLFAQRSRGKDDPNRLICRSFIKTGTLAARERRCFTRAQWERIQEGAAKGATDMQERLRGFCGNNGGQCNGG